MKTFPSLLFLRVAAALDATAGKPNIVFLLADDLGVGSVNCYARGDQPRPHAEH
jgi:hypothetical protein